MAYIYTVYIVGDTATATRNDTFWGVSPGVEDPLRGADPKGGEPRVQGLLSEDERSAPGWR